MTWKDKAVAAVFALAVLAALGTVAVIVERSREERAAKAAAPAGESREQTLVRGIVLDYARAVQRDDPESACVVLDDDAFAAFDCRFGRTDVPRGLAIPAGAEVAVGDVVVQGAQAFVELRAGEARQAVRLERAQRRWRIIRVGGPPTA